jgi:cell division protein FtsB
MIGRLFDKLAFYFLLILLVLLGVSLLRNYQRVKRVDEQIKDKEAEVNEVQKEGQELSQKLEVAQSPKYVESQLRDKLGLAKEGEIVVILPPDDVLRKIAPQYEEQEEVLPEPNWRRWMKLFL